MKGGGNASRFLYGVAVASRYTEGVCDGSRWPHRRCRHRKRDRTGECTPAGVCEADSTQVKTPSHSMIGACDGVSRTPSGVPMIVRSIPVAAPPAQPPATIAHSFRVARGMRTRSKARVLHAFGTGSRVVLWGRRKRLPFSVWRFDRILVTPKVYVMVAGGRTGGAVTGNAIARANAPREGCAKRIRRT